jgi:hypothetical protein
MNYTLYAQTNPPLPRYPAYFGRSSLCTPFFLFLFLSMRCCAVAVALAALPFVLLLLLLAGCWLWVPSYGMLVTCKKVTKNSRRPSKSYKKCKMVEPKNVRWSSRSYKKM